MRSMLGMSVIRSRSRSVVRARDVRLVVARSASDEAIQACRACRSYLSRFVLRFARFAPLQVAPRTGRTASSTQTVGDHAGLKCRQSCRLNPWRTQAGRKIAVKFAVSTPVRLSCAWVDGLGRVRFGVPPEGSSKCFSQADLLLLRRPCSFWQQWTRRKRRRVPVGTRLRSRFCPRRLRRGGARRCAS
jgi:hypothetical protein